jgi:hypothetical protein
MSPRLSIALKVRNCVLPRRSLANFLILSVLLAAPVHAGNIISTIDVQGNSRTQSAVILRELLFQPGDTLTSAVLAESERNLRRLLYLGRVHIRSEAAGPGSLQVVVEVDDLYARALSPLFAGDMEEVSFGAVAVDYNLFGNGQYGRLTAFDDARAGRRVTAQFGDPRLLMTHLQLATEVGWAQEGHRLGLSVSQPFYRLAAPWAYGISATSRQTHARLYSRGTLVARYADRLEAGSLWLVRSYGDDIKVRPGVQLSIRDHSFDSRQGFDYAPQGRRRILPSLVLTVWQPRYVTDRFIQYLGPAEDFQIGSSLTVRAGLSSRTFGSDQAYRFAALRLSPRFGLGGWLVFTSLEASSRWHAGRYENLHTSSSLRLFGRQPGLPWAPTIAIRLRYDALRRPEETGSQFLIGGDSGLRGYPARRFDGVRRIVANMELRPVFYRRTDGVLGGVLFADVGGAWKSDPAIHGSIGVGLRLGLPRVYDTPVVRLDLARGLAGGIWQVSFGLGQYF